MFVLASLFWASAGFAVPPTIFHSPANDGVPPTGAVVVSTGGTRTLHLFMATGTVPSSTGVVCEDGNGDEVCAIEGQIAITGGSSLLDFTPNGDVVFSLSSELLRFNGGDPIAGDLGSVKLGDLRIDAIEPGAIELASGASVAANLALEGLAVATLTTVPEPDAVISSAVAIGLVLFSRLARRRD